MHFQLSGYLATVQRKSGCIFLLPTLSGAYRKFSTTWSSIVQGCNWPCPAAEPVPWGCTVLSTASLKTSSPRRQKWCWLFTAGPSLKSPMGFSSEWHLRWSDNKINKLHQINTDPNAEYVGSFGLHEWLNIWGKSRKGHFLKHISAGTSVSNTDIVTWDTELKIWVCKVILMHAYSCVPPFYPLVSASSQHITILCANMHSLV